jgi:hypothetical protein
MHYYNKRAPITEQGVFVGYQWPTVMIKRKSDGKVRIHEGLYIHPLCTQTNSTEIEAALDEKESQDELIGLKIKNMQNGSSERPETDNNMVQSVKSLQNHKQKLVGTSSGKMTDIEESAMYGNSNQCNEGIYTDSICISDADKVSMEVEEMIRKGFSMKNALLKAIRKSRTVVSNGE